MPKQIKSVIKTEIKTDIKAETNTEYQTENTSSKFSLASKLVKIFAPDKAHARSTRDLARPNIPKAILRNRLKTNSTTLCDNEFDFTYEDSTQKKHSTFLSRISRTDTASCKQEAGQTPDERNASQTGFYF
jgi:hypothetical protein